MVKHIVVTIHGIRTSKHKDNWQDRFQSWATKYSADIEVHSFKYGFWTLLPYISTLPKGFILTKLARDFFALQFKSFIKSKMEANPGAQVHVIAHSFGTWISHEIIKDASIPLSTAHLVAGVISAHLERNGLDEALRTNAVRKILVWASKKDEVCHFAPPPFGHLGYWGAIDRKRVMDRIEPRNKPYDYLEIYNHITEYDHTKYFTEDTFNQFLSDILIP